jgi:Putative Flp pilus-assembly TadE/G-like
MIRRKQAFSWARAISSLWPFRFSRSAHPRNLWRDERGASAVIIGLSLTALIGMVGLGVEVGQWYASKRSLQSGTDAAALGAAYKYYISGNNSGLLAAATADAARNGVVDGENGVTVLTPNNPPTSGEYVGETRAFEVIIEREPSLLFSTFMLDSVTLRTRAVALLLTLSPACVIALDSTAPIGIQLAGSANLTLTGCGMFSNSTTANSMVSNGGAMLNLVADYFAMVGGYDQNGAAVPVLSDPSEPLTGQAPIQDPLASIVAASPPAPAFVSPNNNFNNATHTWIDRVGNSNNAVHFNSGVTFGANANVTIPASVTEVYVSGELRINAGAVVNCTCTFILMTPTSRVNINGNATVTVNAPAAPARYPGIAFYNAAETSSNVSSFGGTGNITFNGALYFPRQSIDYRGDSAGNMNCTRIVARTITFIGNSETNASASNPSCVDVPGASWIPNLPPILVE